LQSRIRKQLQEKPNTEQPPSPPSESASTPSSQPAQPERGIHIITRILSTNEIQSIFDSSKRLSSSLASRTLAVLHGRRVNGTLDLGLPLDITRALTPHEIDSALEWLRKRFPVDEDAAILARIEKEEKEAEERELQEVKRAEELGQFRPQSGTFGAKLGESKDIYGRSVFKEIREKNEARLLAEEEQKRQEWLRGEAKYEEQLRTQLQRNTELQTYNPDAVIEGALKQMKNLLLINLICH
jgi:rhomboid-like protein